MLVGAKGRVVVSQEIFSGKFIHILQEISFLPLTFQITEHLLTLQRHRLYGLLTASAKGQRP